MRSGPHAKFRRVQSPVFEVPTSALPLQPDCLEYRYWRENRRDEDLVIEVHASDQAWLALAELQRPPWWRELEAEKSKLKRELAAS